MFASFLVSWRLGNTQNVFQGSTWPLSRAAALRQKMLNKLAILTQSQNADTGPAIFGADTTVSGVLQGSQLISSHLGFVHPLQDVALHQCLPSSSVCCLPNPGGSLLLCYVILPSSAWSSSRPLPFLGCHSVHRLVHLLSFNLAI